MIICPNCRAKLGDGSSSCVVCGATLGGGPTAPKAPEPAQAAAPAVAATAPMGPAQPKAQIDLAAKPLEDRPLPRNDLIEEAKPQAAPPAQQPQKPVQSQLPPQAPPPPDHPIYAQQQQYQQYPPGYYPQQTATNWQTHPYQAGMPNQCPRCHNVNIVTYYDNGTATCGACYYKFYWRTANDPFSSVGREFDQLFG
jgi:hypothetical protein